MEEKAALGLGGRGEGEEADPIALYGVDRSRENTGTNMRYPRCHHEKKRLHEIPQVPP